MKENKGLPNTGQLSTKYRPDIDGLRAIAVLSVVIFHAFPDFLKGGFVGVDVFFVISGYLISNIILSELKVGNFSFPEFYIRRVRRIFPSLFLVLAACSVVGWLVLLPDTFKQLGKHIAAGAAFVSNFSLWNEAGYFDASADTKPLLHLWSLGIEEQFYIVWPMSVWFCWKRHLNTAVLIIITGLISFIINLATAHSDPTADFYSPLSRFWELQVGCLLAYLTQRDRQFPKRGTHVISLGGTALLAASILLLNKNYSFPGWWAVLPTTGAFLLIAAGPNGWVNQHILSRSPLVKIGLISFPLYLWHWPILSFLRIVEQATPPWRLQIGAVVLSLVLAWLTYVSVEKPIRFGKLRIWGPSIASVGTAAAALFGLSVYAFGGIASRFPAEIQSIANYKYEFEKDARYPECWLGIDDAYDGFAKECLLISNRSHPIGILIWGDSHAARLYPGLRIVVNDTAAVSQTTRSACPPVLGFGTPNCIKSNDYVLLQIKRIKPETVLLFAAWLRYGAAWGPGSEQRTKLLHTIAELHRAGVKKVVVLGPAPYWEDDMPKLVYKAWKNDYPFHRIPARMLTGLNPSNAKVDEYFREFIPESAATLVPVIDLLCNNAGCLTHAPNEPSDLVTWDYGHLTTSGAVLVANQLRSLRVLP